MARSKLPAKDIWHEGGFRFRRRGGSKTQFSIAVRMSADDEHGSWWFSPQIRVELQNPDDKAELLALAERYRYELLHPEEVAEQKAAEEARKLTMREYVDRWRKRRADLVLAGTIQDATAEREEVELGRICAYLGSIALSEIDATTLQKAYMHMAKDGVSEYTRARTHAKLKRLLKQARLDGLISFNPAEDLAADARPKTPKISKEKKDARRITSAEADKLASKLLAEKPDGLKVAIWLARTTGMRRGEILGLRWSDIDLDEQIIKVRRQLGRKGVKAPKTYESSRDLPLSVPIWRYLERWKTEQQAQFDAGLRKRDENGKLIKNADGTYRTAKRKWTENTPVCTNMDGHSWDVTNFNRSLRIYFADCGLGEFTERVEFTSSRKNKDGSPMVQTRKSGYIGASLHSLRHTYATELVANKVDPKTVQALLGHSNIQTTLQLYAEAVEENMRAAANVHAAHFATDEDDFLRAPEEIAEYEAYIEEELDRE